jgi:type I restriction enzyme S subunit
VKFKRETEFQDTEIGKIPREWRIVRLIEVAEVRGNKKPPEDVKSVVFIPMEAVPDNSLYVNYVIRNVGEVKSYVYCEPGDLLVAKITPSFENGKQGIVPYDLQGKFALATTEVYPIKCNNIDKLFLFYLLKYPPIRSKLASLMRGTTGRRRLPREALENTLLPYPPIYEQQRIAEILSTVDRVIEVVDAGVARLEGLKKAVMRELLTGRIRVREENGKPVFYRETEFQETEIGKIPREWKIYKLGELALEMYYGLTAKAVNQLTGLRMLRTTDIKDNYRVDWDSLPYCEITDNRRSNIQKYLLRKNDLVVSRAGTTGMSIFVDKDFNDVIFGSYLIKIKLSESIAYPKFIQYFMQSSLYWNQLLPKQAGSTLKNISLPILKNILTPLPPINEQKLIPEILSTVDRAIELYREERVRVDRLKRGLMDLLLTGKIRVVEG